MEKKGKGSGNEMSQIISNMQGFLWMSANNT